MPTCTTTYNCEQVWFDSTYDSSADPVVEEDVIAYAKGAHAVDINITCVVNTGNVQIQVRDAAGEWFTPAEASFTITDSTLIRLPRANMPDMRILATGDATFAVEGVL